METDEILDTIMLVVTLLVGFFITLTAIALVESSTSIKQVEKTALVALADNTPDDVTLTGADIALMLLIQDDNLSNPSRVVINNNETIHFNPVWFANEADNINTIWTSYLKDLKDLNVDTFEYINYGGVYQWNILLK